MLDDLFPRLDRIEIRRPHAYRQLGILGIVRLALAAISTAGEPCRGQTTENVSP